jgi:hypothetical protein
MRDFSERDAVMSVIRINYPNLANTSELRHARQELPLRWQAGLIVPLKKKIRLGDFVKYCRLDILSRSSGG